MVKDITGTYSLRYEPTRNETVAVGLTAVTVVDARSTNQPRKTIILRNNSPNATDIIYIKFSSAGIATSTEGIILRQFETLTDSTDSGYECYQDTITAICATATGSLAVFER